MEENTMEKIDQIWLKQCGRWPLNIICWVELVFKTKFG